MRVEKIGGRVIITQPVAERLGERRGLRIASVILGAPGTLALMAVWQQAADAGAAMFGILFSAVSALTFHQAQTLGDKVWTLVLNREQETVELDGCVLASFSEVRSVRSSTIEPTRHVLSLVVHRGRGFYDVPLCSIGGTYDDRAVFEQAARLIAEEIGVRAERR